MIEEDFFSQWHKLLWKNNSKFSQQLLVRLMVKINIFCPKEITFQNSGHHFQILLNTIPSISRTGIYLVW